MNELSTTILEQCKNSFKQIRVNLIEATEALYRIKSEELWRETCSSFGEFVEQELQISQSFASKLLSNWNTYVIEGKVAKEELAGVDYEKLYLSQRLPGTLSDKLVRARTWTRGDIKAELSEKDGQPCEHTPITICSRCHERLHD